MSIKKNIKISELIKSDCNYSQNIIGCKFGNLLVIMYAGKKILPKGQKQSYVLAQCDCGHIGTYITNHIKGGRTKSCGCLQAKLTSERATVHGNKRSGMPRGTKEYSIWQSIKNRCKTNTQYISLGIKVCPEWEKSFQTFINDVGRKPSDEYTLERIDNNVGYCPQNCRWATRIEQANNTRRNVFVTINGVKYTLAQAVRELGIGRREIQSLSTAQNGRIYHGSKEYKAIQSRIKRGWSSKDALFTPISKHTPRGKYNNF